VLTLISIMSITWYWGCGGLRLVQELLLENIHNKKACGLCEEMPAWVSTRTYVCSHGLQCKIIIKICFLFFWISSLIYCLLIRLQYRPDTLFIIQLTIDHNPVIVLVVILQSASFVECYSAVELIAANVMEWENALDMQLKVWFFYLLRTRCYLKV
jgi:hypothetical protein